jgi:hypothetical protein
MPKYLDNQDRFILNYRPQIAFVEPEADDDIPMGMFTGYPDGEDIDEQWDRVGRLALAGRLLSEAFQARVDAKVGDFEIKLDPIVDKNVIDALTRRYNPDDPTRITYDQYKRCRQDMTDHGLNKANQINPDEEQIQKIRQGEDVELVTDSQDAKNGLLRPDVTPEAQVIDPIDMDEFQLNLLCILMNLLWKLFLRPALVLLIPPPFSKLIPETICEP